MIVSIALDESVLGSQSDPGVGLEIDDLVHERQGPTEEPRLQREARSEADGLGREHRTLVDPGVPLGGPIEAAELGEGLGPGQRGRDPGLVASHRKSLALNNLPTASPRQGEAGGGGRYGFGEKRELRTSVRKPPSWATANSSLRRKVSMLIE